MPQRLSVTVPALDHDAMMLKRFGRKVLVNGRLERRIVANLIAHLESNGFHVTSVYDGEEDIKVTDMKSAMELIFNLDDSRVYFSAGPTADDHSVVLVLGNGIDVVSDWTFTEGDPDKFYAVMDQFDGEDYA